MITNWKETLAVAWRVVSETEKLDTEHLWEYRLPRVAAAEKDVKEAEAALGHSLDVRYGNFLRAANGWPCFYQSVDLFGTQELLGSKAMQSATAMLEEIVPEALEKSFLRHVDLLPIAVSRDDKDLFVMSRPDSNRPGVVIWFAGAEVERFPDFDEFFLAMIDYNRLRYQRLLKKE